MAIKKKFIGANQVGAEKIQLENNASLAALNAAGSSEVELLKLDTFDVLKFLKLPRIDASAPAPSDDKDIATKEYVDDLLGGGTGNGYAPLGEDGKIPNEYYSSLVITDVFVVADIAARDALSAIEEGDVAKVLDAGAGLPKTYIYGGSAWIEIESGSDVDTVNGQTGTVVLDAGDIGSTDPEGSPTPSTVQDDLDAMLLLSGTRGMAGDLNLDGNDITNVTSMGSVASTNLDVTSGNVLGLVASAQVKLDGTSIDLYDGGVLFGSIDSEAGGAKITSSSEDLYLSAPTSGKRIKHSAQSHQFSDVIAATSGVEIANGIKYGTFDGADTVWQVGAGYTGFKHYENDSTASPSNYVSVDLLSGLQIYPSSGEVGLFATSGAYNKRNGVQVWTSQPSLAGYYDNMAAGSVTEVLKDDGSDYEDHVVAAKKAVLGTTEGVEFGTVNLSTYVYESFGSVTKDGSDMKIEAAGTLSLQSPVNLQVKVLQSVFEPGSLYVPSASDIFSNVSIAATGTNASVSVTAKGSTNPNHYVELLSDPSAESKAKVRGGNGEASLYVSSGDAPGLFMQNHSTGAFLDISHGDGTAPYMEINNGSGSVAPFEIRASVLTLKAGTHIAANSKKIVSLADGVASSDAATVGQVSTALTNAEAYTDGQLDLLAVQQLVHETKTLSAGDITAQSIDVGFDIVGQPWIQVGRVSLVPGDDFTVSGNTITFAGDVATGGPEALEAGDKLSIFYMKSVNPYV